MKNNVVYFFVDSVTWNSIETHQAAVSPTPFLDSLKKESITTTKLYSHGPYTDAATHSLFTGRNCLDDFGYFFKLNTAPIHQYKAFHDAGYETYDFNYPYYILGEEVCKYIDHPVYSTGFIFGSEWGGIFSYYCDLYKDAGLTSDDYLLLKERFRVLFDSWIIYLDNSINKPETFVIHKEIHNSYDASKALATLKEEYKKFKADNKAYIDDFLVKGQSHILVNLDDSDIDTYIDRNFLKGYVEKKYHKLLKEIHRNNLKANVWKSIPSPKRFIHAIKKYMQTRDSSYFMYIANYFCGLNTIHQIRKRWMKPKWQNQHTAYTMYQEGLRILESRKSDKPFYFFFDVEEPHNNIAFFSYDVKDTKVVDDEMQVIQEYVTSLGDNFVGNLAYLLSIRYSDYQIEKFCKGLKEMGLWDTTTILVVADHGSSYSFTPVHNRRVNNFYDECYHIPMLLHHPGLKGREVTSYQYSKDVLPTLMDVLGLELCSDFKGRSMLREEQERPYVISEYMGPGCPDMLRRKIWFSARDENYIVAYKVGVFEPFDNGELAEVFDLSKDPNQFYNINDKIDRSKIEYLLEPLKERHAEICRDTGLFMDKLRKGQ